MKTYNEELNAVTSFIAQCWLYSDDDEYDEYGYYPKVSLWWEEDYDPPDCSACVPCDIEYDFYWDDKEGDK